MFLAITLSMILATTPAETYDVQPIYLVDQVWNSETRTRGTVVVENMPNQINFKINQTAIGKVNEIDEQGSVSTTHTITGIESEGPPQLVQGLSHKELTDVPIIVKINPKGDIVSIKSQQSLSPEQEQSLKMYGESMRSMNPLLFYPKGDVSIGDTWEIDKPSIIDAPFVIENYLQGTCTFEEPVEEEGRTFWRISFDLTLSTAANGNQGNGILKGDMLLHQEENQVYRMDMNMEQNMEMETPNGVIKMKMTIKTTSVSEQSVVAIR